MTVKQVAIIGLGKMGEKYISFLKNKTPFRICCIVDKNKRLTKFIAKKYNLNNYCYDYKSIFLINFKIDIVIIATTLPARFQIIKYCLENNIKYILAEKPLCSSIKQSILIRNKNNNSRISVNYGRRYVSVYNLIKEKISSGEIGVLRSLTIQMGGGQIGSNGVHMTDLARYLTGSEATKVIGFLDKSPKKNPRGSYFKDPGGFAIIFFKKNIRVVIDMVNDHSSPPSISILCSKGRIFFDERKKYYEVYMRPKKYFHLPVSNRIEFDKKIVKCSNINITDAIEANIRNLISKKKVVSNVDDAIKSLEIVAAIHISSANKNTKVKIPLEKKYHEKKYKFA